MRVAINDHSLDPILVEMWPLPFSIRNCIILSNLIISSTSMQIMCKFLTLVKKFIGCEEGHTMFHALVNISQLQCQDP